ncbi:MAG: 2-dehydropantoate 2-reductase [Deltaproteobacteria bacterium]|jgi:2-dehydropantoate 2-reductase|nr:2-dehydropantoate 2-reductase [Deltaproteobacteria bacterium]
MKIAIIGPGAIGSTYGVLLSEAGHEVVLLAGRAAYVEAAAKNGGILVKQGETNRIAPCRMTCEAKDIAGSGLALVLVKAPQTAAALVPAIPYIEKETPVLSLQNGLGNAEELERLFPAEKLLIGITRVGAILLEPGSIHITRIGKSIFGPWRGGDLKRAGEIAALFSAAGLESRAVEDPRPAVWEKLMINVGVNALSAITGMHAGQVLDSPPVMAVAGEAIAEAERVALALGLPVRADMFGNFVEGLKLANNNRPSMLQDVDAGRLTEIEFINGAVSRLGREKGIPTPVNDTLSNLIRGIQSRPRA